MNASAPLEPRAWTRRRWALMIALVLLAHFIAVLVFGAKQALGVRPVTRVFTLQLARANDELIALNDPTLFALPHANDFAPFNRLEAMNLTPPVFRWSESPQWLPLSGEFLAKTLAQFTATNQVENWTLDFKPNLQAREPQITPATALPQQSTVRLRGELAQRGMITHLALPDWPNNDVIGPSKVQVIVDPSGHVISAVLLPPDYAFEPATRDDLADQQALAFARTARFGPASHFTVGQMIFTWHAVPVSAPVNNAVPAQP